MKKNTDIGDWKENEWPTERIIKYYGPLGTGWVMRILYPYLYAQQNHKVTSCS